MKIVGFNFSKISAQREMEIKEKIDVNTSINITAIERTQSDVFKDMDLLKFDFEYDIGFGKEFGKVSFAGFAVLAIEEDKAAAILKEWKKKQIDEELKISLFNLVMDRTHVKALQLEEDLHLPRHLPCPVLKAKPKEEAEKDDKK